MKGNKRLEFLKRIRLPAEENGKNGGSKQETQVNQAHKMIRQEEIDPRKELERRFDALHRRIKENIFSDGMYGPPLCPGR